MKLNVVRTIDRLTSSLKSIINSKDSFLVEDPEKLQNCLIEFQMCLREVDHKEVISIFSLINKACPDLLIPKASYRLQQVTLQLYTLTTLEAYLNIYTSADCHTKKAHKLILEIFNKALIALQDPLTSKYFSQIYMVKSLISNTQYYADAYLILLELNGLLEIKPVSIECGQ